MYMIQRALHVKLLHNKLHKCCKNLPLLLQEDPDTQEKKQRGETTQPNKDTV